MSGVLTVVGGLLVLVGLAVVVLVVGFLAVDAVVAGRVRPRAVVVWLVVGLLGVGGLLLAAGAWSR